MGRYLVLGRGASGEAAAAFLRGSGHSVEFTEGWDGVVASPGVPVKSELQLGCKALARLGWKLLAVTGSKGKSSVVKAVADAIRLAGGRAFECGNYGRPVSDLVGEAPGWAVVEVSSFQLETTSLPPGAFEAAALLNLQEDHLDRHGGVEAYHALKRRLLGFAKRSFDLSGQSGAGLLAAAAADGLADSLAGSYFDNDVLRPNGVAALLLMETAGVPRETMSRALADFEPLPHRMEVVAEIGGVRYVDDSKATSVAALEAGVRMCAASGRPSVRLVAGGLPKGDDPKSALETLTKRVKKVYLIGKCAEAFKTAWGSSVDCEVCGTMERAVEAAAREAVEGETVLLSPGAASFDQFESFGERGDVFADLAKRQGQRKT